MTPTSYDDIFTCFLENCKIQNKNLPSTDEGKYAMIHNACRHYTNKMEEEALKCDDILETIDKELDDSRLLILAYCIKLVYLENAVTEFTDVFSVFQKEIGIKDYQAQVKARQYNVSTTEHKIIELMTNMQGFSVM